MNYLFFDTETTGLPSWKKPLTDKSQPYLVQLAAILCDESKKVRGSINFIVDVPIVIPPKVVEVHGITNTISSAFGVKIEDALNAFELLLHKANAVVAHNIDFDNFILSVAWERTLPQLSSNVSRKFPGAWEEPVFDILPALKKLVRYDEYPQKKFCTMKGKEFINACKIPGKYGHYKWPKLMEAYQILVDPDGFEGAHDAMADVKACMDVFFALKERQDLSPWKGEENKT